MVLHTPLTALLGTELPVIGAPMAGVAGGRLAAAVSAAGGVGMIGVGAGAAPESIEREAELARAGGRPFGIGLMAWALEHRPEQLDAAIAAHPRLISISFGDHRPWVARVRDAGIVATTQVGDVGTARWAADTGVDLLVARGGEGGGHGLNSVATLPLLQGVLDTVELPVVAAGGIATARGLAAVLAAGGCGAWIGTALLSCTEALNTAAARQRVRGARETDTVYSRVFDLAAGVGWPPEYGGRALANEFTRRWVGHEAELARDERAGQHLAQARAAQDYDTAYIYAGQAVGLVSQERSAADVVAELASAARRLLDQHR